MTYSDSAELHINLAALQDNYDRLAREAAGAQCAAVVKADGYGLGLEKTATALSARGCTTFFVAQTGEAMALRHLLPEAVIYVLNGLPDGAAADFAAHDLRPCLVTMSQIAQWQAHCQTTSARAACVFVDSGFNRLGLSEMNVADLAGSPALFDGWQLSLIASHLACADTPDHPMNAAQLERFRHALAQLPDAPASLANSGGIMLGEAYHFDMVRPGIMLYGGAATTRAEDALAPVATLRAPILQTRALSPGDTVGYGASFTASHEMQIGILSLGYGDGLGRHFGNLSSAKARFMLNGHAVPLIGRISMDSLAVDLTDCPIAPATGDLVEIFGPNNLIDDVAAQGNTIAYELLTSLGTRYNRNYS
jgi:alanine racemase